MNFINISKLLILLFILFLSSCKTTNVLHENKKNIKINTDVFEYSSNIDLSIKLSTDFFKNDFYNNLNFPIWSTQNNLIKLKTINTYGKKIENNNKSTVLISNNYFFSLDSKNTFKIYNVNTFDIEKKINLNLELIDKYTYPISLAMSQSLFVASFSNGFVINFDINGNILWSKNFYDIIKTPIKISGDNIIILLTDRIISVDINTGNINWEFFLSDEDFIQDSGGNIIELNHFLFFILPNNRFGQIDSIFGEKIDIELSKNKILNNKKYLPSKLHSYNNILSFFVNNKYLTSKDIQSNEFLLDRSKLNDIYSSLYFNNSLLTLNDNNILKIYNIINKKLFWQADLNTFISNKDSLIDVFANLDSIIVFFKSGKIIEFDSYTGYIKTIKDTKIKNTIQILSNNEYFFINSQNGKTTKFSQ